MSTLLDPAAPTTCCSSVPFLRQMGIIKKVLEEDRFGRGGGGGGYG